MTAIVFWPVLTFDFVRWDDDINVTQNPLLTAPWSWGLAGQLFDSSQALRFKPLHWLLCRVWYDVFGFEPAGWHALNLGLHLAVTALFYLVLRQVFRLLAVAGEKFRGDWAALLGASLWAVHPLRAEPVAWVTASTYPLTSLALLGSFACYLAAYTRGRPLWLGWAWLLAVAAYASYPVAATYGLWLMAVDRWLLPAGPKKTGLWTVGLNQAWCAKHAWFLAPAVCAVGLTLWSRYATPGIFTPAPSVEAVGLPSRVAMALASLVYFIRGLVWPVNLTPNMPPLGSSGGAMLQVAALAGLGLLGLVVVWRKRQQQPHVALVGVGFVALALPCLGWTERPAWPVDRYSYLVHLVLIGGVAGGLIGWAGANRQRLVSCGLLASGLLLGAALAAGRQTMIWRDSTALFTHMEQHPHFADNPRQQGHAYVLWARAEVAAARPTEAAALFAKAQQVYLTAIRAAVGRADYQEALALATHLERHFTLTPIMHREKGAWLLRLARLREALVELSMVRQSMPDDPRTKSLLEEAESRAGANTDGSAPLR